jgi:DNA modification methylase
LELIIKASSNENNIALYPFFGTRTTGVVAKRLKRNFILCSPDFYGAAFFKIQRKENFGLFVIESFLFFL